MFYKLYVKFIYKNWQLYLIYFATLFTIPLENTYMPHYYGEIISSLKSSNFDKGKALFKILIMLWITIQILNLTQSFVNMYIMPKFESFIRQYFFDRIIESYSENYQELSLGKIISMIIRSPGIIQSIFVETKDFLLNNLFTLVSNMIYLSSFDLSLGLIFIACISSVYLISYIYYLYCNKLITNTQNSYDDIYEEIQDTLSNLISIYTSQQSKNEKMRIREYNYRTVKETQQAFKCNNKFRIIFTLLNIIIFLILNYAAYKLLRTGKIKMKGFISIFILSYSIFKHLAWFYYEAYSFIKMYTKINHITSFIESLPVYKSIDGVDIPAMPSIESFKNASNTYDENEGNRVKAIDIEFKNVLFRHKPELDPIYENLNLKIPFKQNLAVMGTIGSGKSTMAKLIVRLQKYQGGEILVNNVKIEDINIVNLRYHITYIPQHPILFNRTLWENISYGLDNSISEEDFYNILRENNMNDLIEIYRSKMHQKVGKTGSNLSGGQRQIIWLIRCILRPSKVIILDEPTSALDEKNTQNVIKLIQKLGKDRTLIVITHDNKLLDYMDRKIFFDSGKIVEDIILNNKTK